MSKSSLTHPVAWFYIPVSIAWVCFIISVGSPAKFIDYAWLVRFASSMLPVDNGSASRRMCSLDSLLCHSGSCSERRPPTSGLLLAWLLQWGCQSWALLGEDALMGVYAFMNAILTSCDRMLQGNIYNGK